MVDFKRYYSELLRTGRRAEPRAEEALQDYLDMVVRIQAAGMF